MSYICYNNKDISKLRDLLVKSESEYNIRLNKQANAYMKVNYDNHVKRCTSKLSKFGIWFWWAWDRSLIDLFKSKPRYPKLLSFEEYVDANLDAERLYYAGSSLKFYASMHNMIDAAEKDGCDIKVSKSDYDGINYGLNGSSVYNINKS